MVKINWTKQSRKDLFSITQYIALDSEKYAKIQLDRIRQKVRQLKNFPKSGRIVPEFNNPEVREIILGSYRIIYRLVSSKKIDILTIHHSARPIKL